MTPIDWGVVAVYCVASLGVGLLLTKKASKGIESFFVSGRELPWWLAGTSMIATAWASDTPLLVTGLVREKGIYGNWDWWALMFSHVLLVFFFAKLWRRSEVVTEVELTELRYGGGEAGVLRGFKAIFWGGLFNIYTAGALPMVGISKIVQVIGGISREKSIVFATVLTAVYCTLSGFWGVVATDFFQFILMVVGAVVLAYYCITSLGGMEQVLSHPAVASHLSYVPPIPTSNFWESDMAYFLSFFLIQWWAFKNADGGGIFVQRMVASKNEREGQLSVLWFNVGHYVLRAWPWIIVALASLAVAPSVLDPYMRDEQGNYDHERAYAAMVLLYMPQVLKGFVVASFLAAFMSTMSTHINWGASYVVNDFYKRFIRKDATESHLLWVSRIASVAIAAGSIVVALNSDSVRGAFRFILMATAGIGPALLLRWFWWRANAWTEMFSMILSLTVALPLWPDAGKSVSLAALTAQRLGMGGGRLGELIVVAFGCLVLSVLVTLLTRPVPRERLHAFFKKVRPPLFGWGPIAREVGEAGAHDRTLVNVFLSIVGTLGLAGVNGGIVLMLQSSVSLGLFVSLFSAAIFLVLVASITEQRRWMVAATLSALSGAVLGTPRGISPVLAAAIVLACVAMLVAIATRPTDIAGGTKGP